MSRIVRHGATSVAILGLLLGCATQRSDRIDDVDLSAVPRESQADTLRLLEQSSFGPTPQMVERVRRQGFAGYLDEQFRLRVSRMPELKPVDNDVNKFCEQGDAGKLCKRDNYSQFPVQTRFFQNALTQPDQLRQRVAFALGQIFVVSARITTRPMRWRATSRCCWTTPSATSASCSPR